MARTHKEFVQMMIATIASSTTTSAAIDLCGNTIVGIVMPAAFTGTAVTFTGAVDGSTYLPLVDTDGDALSVTVAVDTHIMMQPTDLVGVSDIKIVSNDTEAAERTITLVVRLLR